MKVTLKNRDGQLIERKIEVGSHLHGLRAETVSFESGEEVRQVLSGPGFSWMLRLAYHHFSKDAEQIGAADKTWFLFDEESLETLAVAILNLKTNEGKSTSTGLKDVLQDWILQQFPKEAQ